MISPYPRGIMPLMKELALGILLLILVGFGSFLYQNAKNNTSGEGREEPIACTAEARICPNGSAVGRTGPACEFEACPSDAVQYEEPTGFIDSLPILSSIVEGRIGFYTKEPSTISNNITVFAHQTSEEESFENLLVQKVQLTPSDLHPELEDFEILELDGREVYRIVNERFEATVEVTYGIPLDGFLVLVSLRDIMVENWMEDFNIEDLEDLETVEAVVKSVKI